MALRTPSRQTSVACVITFRHSGDRARHDNLLAVLSWLSRWPELPVVLVEQDAKPRLQAELPHPKLTCRFVCNPGTFNKSWGLNVGARLTTAPWLLFHDADIILGHALDDALAARHEGHHAISPFSHMLDLDPDESARVRGGAFDWLPARADQNTSDRQARGEFMPLAGASVLMSRSAYLAVGGWDERFLGWGGEDDAMSDLLQRAKVPVAELDTRPALHLYHRRRPSTTLNQPNYRSNIALLESQRQFSDIELARSAAVRRTLIGHAEKYGPRP
ncbi:MAG: galactosyltransferase-related protein [Wenzhouxiangellaceae bacterium]